MKILVLLLIPLFAVQGCTRYHTNAQGQVVVDEAFLRDCNFNRSSSDDGYYWRQAGWYQLQAENHYRQTGGCRR